MSRYKFDAENHVHTLDGVPLMGVTTVLQIISKPALIPWAVKQTADYVLANWKDGLSQGEREEFLKEAKRAYTKTRDSAGDFGTNVHKAIEDWIKSGKHSELEGKEKLALENFKGWAKEVKFLESEKNLYSESMWLGGICDMVVEIDGKRFVGDVKTSSAIYPEHFLQCAAYAHMLKEMGLYDHFDGMVVVNLKKDGKMDYKFNYDVSGHIDAFKSALSLHKFLK